MAKLSKADDIVERNIRLTQKLMEALFFQPSLLDSLPDKFELVILPENDPELLEHNLALLERYTETERSVVFARIDAASNEQRLQFYAPVPA